MRKRVVTNLISKGFGKFAGHSFHPVIQKVINRSYVRFLGLDMGEFKSPQSYKSLNELFTRKLEVERRIDTSEDAVISPCDALVTQCGDIEHGRALQIKGMGYSVKDFLQSGYRNDLEKYINFYLSPKDYHRYHMPYTLQIKRVIHIPGKLYPVNLRFLRKKVNLFIQNERIILECFTKEGRAVTIVLVGALNVGKMTLVFEKRIETNHAREVRVFEYENLWLKKGELLGYFKMGSTIVLFFEKGLVDLDVKPNDRVRFGQRVATIKKGEENE